MTIEQVADMCNLLGALCVLGVLLTAIELIRRG